MNTLSKIFAAVLLAAAFVSTNAFAVDSAKFLLRVGLDVGGDKLVHVIYTDGSTADIRAGNGLSVAAGGSFPLTDNLELDATVGYEFSMIMASNGDITWSYFPVDLVALYKVGRFALGGGVTEHINPSISGSGIASTVSTSYDNAVGSIVEADYMIDQSIYLGLRATNINYKTSGYTSSGNSVGLTILFRF